HDPYGFPESTPGAGGGDVTTALWLGVASALLAAVGVCMCYVPYFIALPVGAYGAYKGYQALASVTDARDRTMATVALVTGSISAVISAIFAVFVIAYAVFFVLYMGVIMAAIGMGAASEPPAEEVPYEEW
ncbi:MAG: hypothetical protein ACK4YP_14415, partial [Myxococcota bacterium]